MVGFVPAWPVCVRPLSNPAVQRQDLPAQNAPSAVMRHESEAQCIPLARFRMRLCSNPCARAHAPSVPLPPKYPPTPPFPVHSDQSDHRLPTECSSAGAIPHRTPARGPIVRQLLQARLHDAIARVPETSIAHGRKPFTDARGHRRLHLFGRTTRPRVRRAGTRASHTANTIPCARRRDRRPRVAVGPLGTRRIQVYFKTTIVHRNFNKILSNYLRYANG